MKARNILIVIGVVMILLNLLAYSGDSFDPPEDRESRIGYLIGWNIFNIVGVLLLVIAYFRHKKMTKKNDQEMIDNFLK